jgi:protein ImuB
MIGCVLVPRLSLVAAIGDRRGMLGRPVALAPEPSGPQVVGETSGAAEALGIRRGMRLAEALARCPSLVLVPPDPPRAEAAWERSLRRLEALGAAVEPGQVGEAYFSLEALRGLYGSPEAVLGRARQALGTPARFAGGPSRLCAYALARRARASRRAPVLSGEAARRLVADLPVAILGGRLAGRRPATSLPDARKVEEATVVDALERLGVRTLGELAALPSQAVADRFGELGLRALRIACGVEGPLRPRRPAEQLAERLELPEAASGTQLVHALELLIDRLLASPARRGRSFRRLRLEAQLAGGGGWRAEVALRDSCGERGRLRLVLTAKLERLPGPARVLGLRALETGPPSADQPRLARSPEDERRDRLAEGIRQARAVAGRDALLRVVEVDPDSRVPERRMLLMPLPEPGR